MKYRDRELSEGQFLEITAGLATEMYLKEKYSNYSFTNSEEAFPTRELVLPDETAHPIDLIPNTDNGEEIQPIDLISDNCVKEEPVEAIPEESKPLEEVVFVPENTNPPKVFQTFEAFPSVAEETIPIQNSTASTGTTTDQKPKKSMLWDGIGISLLLIILLVVMYYLSKKGKKN